MLAIKHAGTTFRLCQRKIRAHGSDFPTIPEELLTLAMIVIIAQPYKMRMSVLPTLWPPDESGSPLSMQHFLSPLQF